MAEETGTLWEHDKPQASCNHGFASVAAVLLMRCILELKSVKSEALQFSGSAKVVQERINAIFSK